MKISLVLAAAALALSLSSSAMALDVNVARTLDIQGFFGFNSSLGTVTFTALGRSGQFCDYLMDWESPFNPNDVELCILRELRTPTTPSCIRNEQRDLFTAALAGPAGPSYCAGFNVKGESFEGIMLIFGESPLGLVGVAVIPTIIPVVYPVITTIC